MSSFTKPLKYTQLTYKYHGRDLFRIDEEFEYSLGSLENPLGIIRVPKGFITDFASIPVPLYYLFNPAGKWAKAAVVHDFVTNETWKGDFKTFAIANAIFKEAMMVSGVNPIIVHSFFLAVSLYSYIRPFLKKPTMPSTL